MGIGRSSLLAACILGELGRDPEEAFSLIEKSRRRPVPDTPEQRAWAERFVRRRR